MKKFLLIIFLSTFSTIFSSQLSVLKSIPWYCSKQNAIDTYLKDKKHVHFHITNQTSYKNQIVSYIRRINKDKYGDIEVYSSKVSNKTDLLFIKEKLFSISQEIYNIDQTQKDSIFKQINSIYGSADVKKSGAFTNYNYESVSTKVQLITRRNGSNFDMKIYYYPSDLFSYILLN